MGPNLRLALTGGAVALALGTGSAIAVAASGSFGYPSMPGFGYFTGTGSCTTPALPGSVVDVTLGNMMGAGMMGGGGGMMGGYGRTGFGGGMRTMWVEDTPAVATAGTVSLRVSNRGNLTHELVVLPLSNGQQAGQRPVGSDGRVSESGSLGEASNDCGADEGDGISAGSAGWTTLNLQPGRYELVCNLPGHYVDGMYAELDVVAAG